MTALAVALASAVSATPAVAVAVAAANDTVRVIVTYDDVASARAVAGAVGRDGTVTRTMRRTPHLVARVPRSSLARIRGTAHVRSVQLDIPEHVSLDSSLRLTNADAVHADGVTGAGSTVAVIDTGVDVDHPFLGGRVVAQYCSSTPSDATEQSLCPDGSTQDTSADVDGLAACLDGTTNLCDHGTHVAGIAAGNGAGLAGAPAAGVAPGASIIAMQVFTRFTDDADCPGGAPCIASYPSDQVNALDALAALDSAHPEWNVVAANLSLGGGLFTTACDDDARTTPVDTLLAQGVATVVSAGNGSSDAAVSRPGCISAAVTVGATDDDDTVAGYSNRGALLDVLAPGSGIESSVPDDGYDTKSGTSMAAPHVTGALAVLREKNPTRPVADLVEDLRGTGVGITYPSDGGTVTTPRIDVLAAIGVPVTPCTPPRTTARGLGRWQADYRRLVRRHADAGRVCLLAAVRAQSTVFDEHRPFTTVEDAARVLWPKNPRARRDTFDAHLAALWLNVASGAVRLSQPLDADGNGTTETTVGAFVRAAETTRNSVSRSATVLTRLKGVIARVNRTHSAVWAAPIHGHRRR
ncbi:S8 family serine peptidase [Oryzobacter telluris]|uniref:S8 family peptidase n=1 Tax=Oryzobacter telluris TaxID=3149179 RepID=UPI00370D113F